MSRDLISRSALIEQLKEDLDDCDIQESLEFFGVYDIINSQPTAYNVDKVVDQLQHPTNYTIVCGKHHTTVERAVEIVKAGGAE